MRAYLAGSSVTVEGEPTRLDPLPVGPVPVWVGGRSEASMRRAGRAGEVWMPYLCSPDRVTRGLRLANDVAAEQGRGAVTGGLLAWSAIAPSRAEARTLAVGTLKRIYGQDMDRIVDACVPYGSAADVVARFAEYADAGAEQILFGPLCAEGQHAAAIEELGAALGAL